MTDKSDSFQRDLLRCTQPAAQASSLPADCYHSDAVLKKEINQIFLTGWIGLGRADRFTTHGQYETLEIAGVPLILIKDKQGQLRAFNNACRHRGARLLNGSGITNGIRCSFHSWCYHTNGQFVSAPHMEGALNFDKKAAALHEFSLRLHLGFIFVCFSDTPPDFATYLGDFDDIHLPWPLESLVSTRRITMEFNCNWKLFLDVFNEYYHLQYVHPDSLNDAYYRPDPANTVTGEFASQFGETDGSGGLLPEQQAHVLPPMPGLNGRAAKGARYTWLFPNMTFALNPEAMWIYEAYPITPDRCLAIQTLCFPPMSVALNQFETKANFYYQRFDEAVEEDRIALENQQKGLTSPFTRPGRYEPLMEPSVHSFASWYAKKMMAPDD